MQFKRILCLALCCFLGLGTGVLATQVECDDVYCFESADFSQDDTLTGICITGLPDGEVGTVMLGRRVLRCGDILTADQIEQMTLVPLKTTQDTQACVTYLPIYPDRVETDAVMTISIRGKEDKTPVAEDSAMETYKNLSNTTKLKATDPEGENLTFTVIRQPRRGQITIAPDGTVTYTPKKNKVGIDSFTYTATDPAGQVSREATVTVEILKPGDTQPYTDTVGLSCRFAAEWMKNTGLFVGEQLGGTACFQPEKTVSRGEFVTMLVKALDLPVETSATTTGFDEDVPNWLKPYLAAALRCGITENWPHGQTFGAAEPISGAEAALLVQNALGLTVEAVAAKENDGELPAWAMDAVEALSQQGMTLEPDQPLKRSTAAQLLYQATTQTTPATDLY